MWQLGSDVAAADAVRDVVVLCRLECLLSAPLVRSIETDASNLKLPAKHRPVETTIDGLIIAWQSSPASAAAPRQLSWRQSVY